MYILDLLYELLCHLHALYLLSGAVDCHFVRVVSSNCQIVNIA